MGILIQFLIVLCLALFQLLGFKKKDINFLWFQRKGESNLNHISEIRVSFLDAQTRVLKPGSVR